MKSIEKIVSRSEMNKLVEFNRNIEFLNNSIFHLNFSFGNNSKYKRHHFILLHYLKMKKHYLYLRAYHSYIKKLSSSNERLMCYLENKLVEIGINLE